MDDREQGCFPTGRPSVSRKRTRRKTETVPLPDVIGVLEPFIGLASRSREVFELIHNALTNLYELTGSRADEDFPITFNFINKEFQRFVSLAQDNEEIQRILHDLCKSLNLSTVEGREKERGEVRRASILDPGFVRVAGSRTTSTSAKVEGTATAPKTKMVSAFKTAETRRHKPQAATKRRNTCRVCNATGHQARTCPDILLEANSERADAFFKQLVLEGKVETYLNCMAKRTRPEHMNNITDRIRKWQTTQ